VIIIILGAKYMILYKYMQWLVVKWNWTVE